jgi:hypothetical protein
LGFDALVELGGMHIPSGVAVVDVLDLRKKHMAPVEP